MTPTRQRWGQWSLQSQVHYRLSFPHTAHTKSERWETDRLVEVVVEGLWRARFLKDVKEQCERMSVQWKRQESLAAPDVGWEAIVQDNRRIALQYYAQHSEDYEGYVRARAKQRCLLEQRATLRQCLDERDGAEITDLTQIQQRLVRVTRKPGGPRQKARLQHSSGRQFEPAGCRSLEGQSACPRPSALPTAGSCDCRCGPQVL
eukprot:6674926-Pyramimonas_sp.AAC.1